MPKRRRNRKNRKGLARKAGNVANKENSVASPSCEVVRTCFDDDSLNRSKAVSPLDLVTPLRNPNQRDDTEPFEDDLSPIKTTPVNKKRSMTRPERKKCSSMNVTNLNVLFDSNFIYDSPRSASDICVNKADNSYKKRSNSSIPKLNSPTPVKPVSRTGAGDMKKFELEEPKEISETPRVSKVLLLCESKSDEMYDTPPLNNHRLTNDKIDNCSRNVKFYNGGVNVNPYLNKEVNACSKDGSFGEISFFSSNLFQHKSSSTPIEKLNQANNIVDYLKDSLRKENVNDSPVISKLDLPNNLDISAAANLNLNLNKTPLSEKVLNKEDSIGSLKIQTVNLSKRTSYKTSPKSNRILSQSRIFNKRHSLTYSRLNVSRRSSVDSVESASKHSKGLGEKLLSRLKKYTRVSQRWSVKVMEMCTQLGVQLKNSLSSVCNIYNDKSMLPSSENSVCKCEEYRADISNLNLKIEELTEEIRLVKSQIEKETSNKENIEMLSQELNKVREELSQFKDLRAELESIKEQLKCSKSPPSGTTASVAPPPPPPCLPPPPPPPLPPPLMIANPLKISKKINTKAVPTDDSRPVISLDDILKVKLKKTSDRSNYLTPTSRRLSQPLVSMDMLKQVKLRPASRPSLRADTPDTGASSASTSPHSSLCRLLNNDGSMFRLKRLRKVGGYSLDSVYRRNLMGKREREGS